LFGSDEVCTDGVDICEDTINLRMDVSVAMVVDMPVIYPLSKDVSVNSAHISRISERRRESPR